jgi:hypothetical protein
MRNHWVRDVADFAKFGIVRHLISKQLSLGVVWWLTDHAKLQKPLTGYLNRQRPNPLTACDADLLNVLGKIHERPESQITVADLETSTALPKGTKFHSDVLRTTTLPRAERLAARRKWFERAMKSVAGQDVVLLDPDTGVLKPDAKVENSRGEEYASLDEVRRLLDREQSVVIVQFGKPQNFESEPVTARARLATLKSATAGAHPEPFGLWWKDGHKIGLLVAPCHAHGERLEERRASLLAHPGWSKQVTAL